MNYQDPTNAQRAEWGLAGLKGFTAATGEVLDECSIVDLIADLMHHEHQNGDHEDNSPEAIVEAFRSYVETAAVHFTAEVDEEKEGEGVVVVVVVLQLD